MTEHRITLESGGSLEVVKTTGKPDVVILVDAQRQHIAVDLNADEVAIVRRMLGEG